MRAATTQDPPRDRTREFEAPPPKPAAPGAPATTPSRPPPWIADVLDAAPLVLVVIVALAVLRKRTWRRLVLRVVLSVAVACAGAGAAFYATYLAGCQAMQCVDTAGLVPMLAGLGTGSLVGVTALVLVWRWTAH